MNYHVAKNGVQSGPMPEAEVMAKLQSGEFSTKDLCWAEGMIDWQTLGDRFSIQAVAPASDANPYAPPTTTALPDEPASGYHPGFWWRFLAYFVDGIIMNIVGMIAGFLMGLAMVAAGAGGEMELQLAGAAVGILVSWLYHALMESSGTQGSVGKMLCGIRVTDLNGQRISFGRATGRYFGKIISGLIFCIGFLMCIWTDRKQCLHDSLAGCLLYRKR